ncbi:uncharacterized protein LOC107047740 [Diachasma alloeum]|uniref:uncharacterized protein LOC107047740 n=1 Tax=Diachasma alloeum TaxID=454923 RepID=UPI000738508E|nr:uncharacterized protein LOC107047740 [Diachasma alloeum]
MAPQKTSQFEKLVVRAIKTLQDIQGSTSKEISNYLSREYDVPSEEIKRQVQLALRRGIDYGLLKRQKGGTYVFNKELVRSARRDDDTRECSTAFKKLRAWRKSRGRKRLGSGRKSRGRGRRGRGRRRKRSGRGKKRRGGRRRRRSRRRSRGRK